VSENDVRATPRTMIPALNLRWSHWSSQGCMIMVYIAYNEIEVPAFGIGL